MSGYGDMLTTLTLFQWEGRDVISPSHCLPEPVRQKHFKHTVFQSDFDVIRAAVLNQPECWELKAQILGQPPALG